MDLRLLCEKEGRQWIATCLELNLYAQAETSQKALQELEIAIEGYLKTVFDTDDVLSIPELLNRPAPWSKFLKYWIAEKVAYLDAWRIQLFHPKISFR